MKVKAIRDYFDKELMRNVSRGEILEVSEARAEVLTTTKNDSKIKMCDIIATTPAPEVDTPAKKRGGRPKKTQEVK